MIIDFLRRVAVALGRQTPKEVFVFDIRIKSTNREERQADALREIGLDEEQLTELIGKIESEQEKRENRILSGEDLPPPWQMSAGEEIRRILGDTIKVRPEVMFLEQLKIFLGGEEIDARSGQDELTISYKVDLPIQGRGYFASLGGDDDGARLMKFLRMQKIFFESLGRSEGNFGPEYKEFGVALSTLVANLEEHGINEIKGFIPDLSGERITYPQQLLEVMHAGLEPFLKALLAGENVRRLDHDIVKTGRGEEREFVFNDLTFAKKYPAPRALQIAAGEFLEAFRQWGEVPGEEGKFQSGRFPQNVAEELAEEVRNFGSIFGSMKVGIRFGMENGRLVISQDTQYTTRGVITPEDFITNVIGGHVQRGVGGPGTPS